MVKVRVCLYQRKGQAGKLPGVHVCLISEVWAVK